LKYNEAIDLLLSDRRLFIESLVQIEDKSQSLIPFVFNPIQNDIYNTSTGRDIYVKPAQIGASSYFIADALVDCLTVRGTTAVIISYDEFITGRLLRKAQNFYEILKKRIPSIDKMVHKSASEKTFERTHSSFFISSARSFSGVRGETIHNLILDEFGFWMPGDAERVFAAALQRVPLNPRTKVRILSTPNGEDNEFYETYMAAKEGKKTGGSVFTHHFYRWFDHPEYTMPSDSMFALPGDEHPELDNLQPDEILLMDNWGLSFDQIRWRRYKITEVASLHRAGKTRLLFQQEYPEDDVSCFQSAGDQVYDHNQVNDMAGRCYPAPLNMMFANIWEDKEEGMNYLVALDPGMGKTSESVATVWRFTELSENNPKPFIHVATLSGLYPEDEMAEKTKDLAYYYNTAIIAAEDSLGVISHLKDYPELYYRTDPVTGRVSGNIGWHSNVSTKPYMITEMNRHLHMIDTHDIRLVAQLRNIRWIQGARGERAVAVGADDYHDSAAIAIVCRESRAVERGLVGVSGWPDSWGR